MSKKFVFSSTASALKFKTKNRKTVFVTKYAKLKEGYVKIIKEAAKSKVIAALRAQAGLPSL